MDKHLYNSNNDSGNQDNNDSNDQICGVVYILVISFAMYLKNEWCTDANFLCLCLIS